MKKYFLLLVLTAVILLPSIAQAQVDQRCWIQSACVEYVSQNFGISKTEATNNNFYSAEKHKETEEACKGKTDPQSGEPLGFCLPAGKANTGISFGGVTSFANIGEFIQYIYRYGFIIGSIIAVLMVMIAGVMWIFSGGSQEVIGKARKRIANATIGLVLMALSYTILSVVNPYLVNFRLPDIWLINERGLAEQYCNDMSENTLIFPVGTTNGDIKKSDIDNALKQKKFTMKASDAKCGETYVFRQGSAQGDGQTCNGNRCGHNHACVPFGVKVGTGQKTPTPTCMEGDAILHLAIADPITQLIQGAAGAGIAIDQIEDDYLDTSKDPEIFAICDTGTKKYVKSVADDVGEAWDDKNSKGCGKETWILTEISASPKEYLIQYNNIIGDTCAAHKGGAAHWCDNSSHKIIGYTIQHEIKSNWSTEDPFLYIGSDGVGKWNGNVSVDNLLNWDDQKLPDCKGNRCTKGIYVEGGITQSNFVPMIKCWKQEPDECCGGTDKPGYVVTPLEYCGSRGGN